MTDDGKGPEQPLPADLELLIDQRVSERAERGERRLAADSRRRWALAASLLTVLGVSGITWLPRLYIERAVQNQLNAANNSYQELFEFQTDYQEFLTLSLSTTNDRGALLRPQNLDDIASILRRIKDRPQIRLGPPLAFSFHLREVFATLVSAGMASRVRELEELFENTPVLLDPAVLELLTAHYGLLVVGSTSQPIPGSYETTQLRHYANQAGQRDLEASSLFWRTLLEFRLREGKSPRSVHALALDSLLLHIERLPSEPRNELAVRFHTFAHPSRFMKEPNVSAIQLAETVNDFLSEYPLAAPPARTSPEEAEVAPLPIWSGRLSGHRMPTSDFYLQADLARDLTEGWVSVSQVSGRLASGETELRLLRPSDIEGLTEFVALGACDAQCLGVDLRIRGQDLDDRTATFRGAPWAPRVSVGGVGGELVIDVLMRRCGSSSCGYTIAILGRESSNSSF